jgi:hypothetical protein
MSIIYILSALLILATSESTADPKYVMPRELVEQAREIGCTQVEDFFDVNGMIGAPYVYGYLPGRPEDSAAFWCERSKNGERQVLLAIRVAPGRVEGALGCPRLIVWNGNPGGLELYRNPSESLAGFTYLDPPHSKGPRDQRVLHNAIRSSVPGQSTTFYCHDGRWLIRSLH